MDLRIGTYNIRTLYKPCSLEALLQQLQHYHMQITAIQETKWMENNVHGTKTQAVLQREKQTGKREFGVANTVEKR
jgi:hypothetical protein